MTYRNELLERLRAAGSPEELRRLAELGSLVLTAEMAEKAFAELHPGKAKQYTDADRKNTEKR